jgi:hypothetical protein
VALLLYFWGIKLEYMREALQLKPEEEIILLAADINPEQSILDRLNELIPAISDWEVFTKMAIDRAAAPLIVDKLPKLSNASLFPDGVLRSLKQASLRTLTRNMLLTEHFRQVVRAFNDAQIPVITLKGAMLSEWLYGNINLRQFSDLDLLVPQDKGLAALEVLRKMGYVSNDLTLTDFITDNTSIVHYKPMFKNGVSVEIHIRVHSEMESYSVDLQEMWKQAVPITLHGVTALGFCLEDLLMHLCFHLDKHFISGQFQFTSMYDIVNMLNHKGNRLDWDLFEEKCMKAKTESVTYKYLLFAQKYLNGKLPVTVSRKYGFMLEPKDERIFLGILRGRGIHIYTAGMLKSLGHLNGLGKRFRYLFGYFFPTTDFMMKRYHLKRKSQLLLYYPYRQLSAVKTLWLTIKKAFS